MYQRAQKQSASCGGQKRKRSTITLLIAILLMACYLPATAQQKKATDKNIQAAINSFKATYDDEKNDFITDGQRSVWVKSYRSWTPADFNTLQKEAPHVLKFLRQAINHNRLDVIEQLLPGYYRYRGGAKAFAEDIGKLK